MWCTECLFMDGGFCGRVWCGALILFIRHLILSVPSVWLTSVVFRVPFSVLLCSFAFYLLNW